MSNALKADKAPLTIGFRDLVKIEIRGLHATILVAAIIVFVAYVLLQVYN